MSRSACGFTQRWDLNENVLENVGFLFPVFMLTFLFAVQALKYFFNLNFYEGSAPAKTRDGAIWSLFLCLFCSAIEQTWELKASCVWKYCTVTTGGFIFSYLHKPLLVFEAKLYLIMFLSFFCLFVSQDGKQEERTGMVKEVRGGRIPKQQASWGQRPPCSGDNRLELQKQSC